jgi:hypothetical protein
MNLVNLNLKFNKIEKIPSFIRLAERCFYLLIKYRNNFTDTFVYNIVFILDNGVGIWIFSSIE